MTNACNKGITSGANCNLHYSSGGPLAGAMSIPTSLSNRYLIKEYRLESDVSVVLVMAGQRQCLRGEALLSPHHAHMEMCSNLVCKSRTAMFSIAPRGNIRVACASCRYPATNVVENPNLAERVIRLLLKVRLWFSTIETLIVNITRYCAQMGGRHYSIAFHHIACEVRL